MIKKIIAQGLIYILEILVVITINAIIQSRIDQGSYFGWTDEIFTSSFLSSAAAYFVIYQILIHAFISLANASRNEANLVIRNIVDYVKLQVSNRKPIDSALDKINYYLVRKKGKYMFSSKDIKCLSQLENIFLKYRIGEISKSKLFYIVDSYLLELNFNNEYNQSIGKNSVLINLFFK